MLNENQDFCILIADDNSNNLKFLSKVLSDNNYRVRVSSNGKQVLKSIAIQMPDLILLDINMPEMDGFEACKIIRDDKKYNNLPIIFLTAKTDKESIVTGFEIGGQDYITKPFDINELLARVKTHLEVKKQREILKNMNQILEEKVKERTALLNDAYQELQGLDVAKNNFLSMLSHEIRTPLNGIIGASYILNDVLKENSEIAEFVEMLKVSVNRLEKFSTTALLITELQTNSTISKEDEDLVNIINECIDENTENPETRNKNLSFEKNFFSDRIKMNLNKELLKRAINNILENAIQYSFAGQKININLYEENKKNILEIRDEGKGFPEKVLKHLFEPFEIGEKHYDDNIGLSLIASKQIIEAHGGNIIIKNRDDKGASVKLSF